MRNLKKLLAVIVTIAMIATFAIPAFAATSTALSDVKGTAFESAAMRLNALGIITGYTDGSFKPDATITRAEFAAVVIRALGLETSAKASAGTTKFSDVPASHWAAGYINMASSLKIINGRPSGKFGPSDPVKYEEAVTMVMRALGYEPAALANGGYPAGYIIEANTEGVTDDVAGVLGSSAPRGVVAQLVDNALTVEMMGQTAFGSETKYEKNGKTLMADYLKLDEYEAKVLSTGDKLEVKYTSDAKNGDKANTREKLSVFSTVSQLGIEDAIITMYVKDSTVFSISTDSTVIYDTISAVNGDDSVADINANTDELENVTDITLNNADEDYDVAQDTHDLATMNVEINTASKDNDTDLASELLGKYAKVVISDGKVIAIYAYATTEGGLISDIKADYITYTKGDNDSKKLRGLEDPDSLLVVIDGKVANYSDLKAGMYFDSWGTDDVVIAATTAKAEGKLAKAKSDDTITVGTDEYDLAGNSYFSEDAGDSYDDVAGVDSFSNLLKTDVTVYLNNEGDAVYVKGNVEDETDSFYGFATSVDQFNDKIKIVKDVDGEEDTVTYDADIDTDNSDNDLADVVADLAGVTDIATDADTDERMDVFYKFVFDKDNKIVEIDDADYDTYGDGAGTDTGVTFNDDSDFILADDGTRIYVADDTLIFDATSGDDISVLKWADIKGTDLAAADDVVAYTAHGDVSNPDFVIIENSEDAAEFGGTDGYLAFITDMYRVDADNYEVVATLPGGESKTFTVDDGDLATAHENNAIAYKLTSTADTIEIVEKATYNNLATLISGANSITTDDDDWASIAATALGDEDAVDGNYITIGATTYKVASDALIYSVNDDRDEFTAADLSDIDGANDTVTALTDKGVIKVLFFYDATP